MAEDSNIAVLLVDDHAVVREGMQFALERASGITVAGEAGSGAEALAWMQAHAGKADVVLMDVDMPGMNGLEASHQLHATWPETGIILLTTFDQYSAAARRAGARGYLLKGSTVQDVLAAIRAVHRGAFYFQEWPDQDVVLTDREVEVLTLVAESLSNTEIAQQLGWSERAVRTHVSHILTKLGARGREQAVYIAMRRGYMR